MSGRRKKTKKKVDREVGDLWLVDIIVYRIMISVAFIIYLCPHCTTGMAVRYGNWLAGCCCCYWATLCVRYTLQYNNIASSIRSVCWCVTTSRQGLEVFSASDSCLLVAWAERWTVRVFLKSPLGLRVRIYRVLAWAAVPLPSGNKYRKVCDDRKFLRVYFQVQEVVDPFLTSIGLNWKLREEIW